MYNLVLLVRGTTQSLTVCDTISLLQFGFEMSCSTGLWYEGMRLSSDMLLMLIPRFLAVNATIAIACSSVSCQDCVLG